MRAARTFAYVSLGILALAGAFLGAQTVQGQGGGLLVAGEAERHPAGVDDSGMIWVMHGGGHSHAGPIPPPKAGNIISLTVQFGGGEPSEPVDFIRVLYDDGDWFTYYQGSWTLYGNIFGTPTQAIERTWGRIKADRR